MEPYATPDAPYSLGPTERELVATKLGQVLVELGRGEDPIAVLVAQGRQVEIIRPSRRTRIQGPTIDVAELAMPPPDLVRIRTPRYARRRGGPTGRLLPLSTN